jgi:myo-inositol-1(or 4)-monophosphatase
MGNHDRQEDLQRIEAALTEGGEILSRYTPGEIEAAMKAGDDPVTEADLAVDAALKRILPRAGEGWLSEETADDASRLSCERTWIVDPLDGTREFVLGIPEFCISIALVENGIAAAGGIFNPATGEKIVGSRETGVTLNGEPVQPRTTGSLAEANVLASRSEVKRGEWEPFERDFDFSIQPMGSVAYKFGLVAAGLADATWTLVPKHEWDIAAGVVLVAAAGGSVRSMPGEDLALNRPHPKLTGLVAISPGTTELWGDVESRWTPNPDPRAKK